MSILTRPAQARRDALCPEQDRRERKSEASFRKTEGWNGWAAEVVAGRSKHLSSAAAASEGPRRTLWGARCDE